MWDACRLARSRPGPSGVYRDTGDAPGLIAWHHDLFCRISVVLVVLTLQQWGSLDLVRVPNKPIRTYID